MGNCEDKGTGDKESSPVLETSEEFIVDANSPNAAVGELAQMKITYRLPPVVLMEDFLVPKHGEGPHE